MPNGFTIMYDLGRYMKIKRADVTAVAWMGYSDAHHVATTES